MSNVLNLKGVKIFAIALVALALLATFGVLAVEKASADCTVTMTLRVGSRGAEVMCLQTKVGASADGVFGPHTKAAVMAFQAAHGLVADGIVGPMTRAALMGAATGNFPPGCTSAAGYSSTTGMPCNTGTSSGLPAGCSSTAGYSPLTGAKCDGSTSGGSSSSNNGPLSGGAGDINDVTLLGTPSSENVGEGEAHHKVLGFEVEADNGSDLALTSAKIEFDESAGTDGGSTHLNDYISGVSVWMGSTKVGSADVEDFTKTDTGVYSKSVSLSGARVNADKKVKFYVAVDGQDNVDSDDMDDTWSVELISVRFNDATGAILTFDADGITQNFNIESAADASDAKLTLTEASDNPNAGVVQVDDGTDTTDNVPLLKFKVKATGADLWMDELPVLLTVTGATNVTDVTSNVTLTIDGQDFSLNPGNDSDTDGTCDSDNSCVVTFSDMDLTLHEGDSVDAEVDADINGVGSLLDSGDSLQADITSSERDDAVVAVGDENGDDLGTSSTDRVGTVSGEPQGFYNQGVSVAPGSTMKMESIANDSAADTAQATITFKVTAIGEDIYLEKAVASSTSTALANSNHAQISTSGGTALSISGTLASSDNNSDEETNTFKIPNGQTASFTLTLSGAGAGAQYRGVLYALMYALTDSATATGVYSLDMGVDGSYKTPYTFVSGS